MHPIPQVDRRALASLMEKPYRPLIIDVLPEEEFNIAHLPGARNACVYNITFVDDVKKLAPDPSTPLILYGSSSRNLASSTAAEKLRSAGYTHVSEYQGGLEDWQEAGETVEGEPNRQIQAPTPSDGLHPIDVSKSRIEWTGRNLTGSHSGTLRLRSGQIEIRDGRPVRGRFVVEMKSMANTDIQDSTMRQILIAHLQSDDFFDVERFPEAEFQLTSIIAIADAPSGSPNCDIIGELTLKNVSREIRFPAILAPTQDGLLAADAHFDIDRTRWGVLYGSGKFYEKLGKHLVHDEISLALKLITLP